MADLAPDRTALYMSAASLVLSGLGFGWNIYREVVLKARVKVTFGVKGVHHPDQGNMGTRIMLEATNWGPGKVQLRSITGKKAGACRRLLMAVEKSFIVHDYTDPLCGKLPAELDVGQTLILTLPYDEKCMLGDEITHIGVTDSFGRTHWAKSNAVVEAKEHYRKDFLK